MRFLWHQFSAGPKWRFVTFPFVIVFLSGLMFNDSTLSAVFAAVIGTMFLCYIAFPEPTVFRAFGMSSDRTSRLVWAVLGPIALVGVVTSLLAYPLNAGAPAAFAAVLTAVVSSLVIKPVGDARGAVEESASGSEWWSLPNGRAGFFGQYVWHPLLSASLLTGVVTGLAAGAVAWGLSIYGPARTLAMFALLPVGVYMFWCGAPAFKRRVTPLIARSFGIPMKRWYAHVIPASLLAGALIAGLGFAVATLTSAVLPFDGPAHGWCAFVACGIVAAAVTALTCVAGPKVEWFSFPSVMFAYFWLVDFFQLPFDASRSNLVTIGAPLAVLTAIIIVVSAVIVLLTLMGRVQLNSRELSEPTQAD